MSKNQKKGEKRLSESSTTTGFVTIDMNMNINSVRHSSWPFLGSQPISLVKYARQCSVTWSHVCSGCVPVAYCKNYQQKAKKCLTEFISSLNKFVVVVAFGIWGKY